MPFSAPHTPFQASREYYDRFADVGDEAVRVYRAMVAQLDAAVGRILGELEAQGIADSTLVMFTSDNGGAAYTGGTTNAPLRGGKMTLFEGGLGVPFLVRWDGVLPAGAVVDTPVVATDFFVTSAAAASVALPRDRIYDGVDLRPLVLHPEQAIRHDALFWKTMYGVVVRRGSWKLILDDHLGTVRLYDLAADPGESRDVSSGHPGLVDELTRRAREWAGQLSPPLWPNLMEVHWQIDGEGVVFPI